MKNKRRITGILAALVLALIGTVALVAYVRSAKDKAVADEALVDVYVVDKLVPKGAEPATIKSSVSIVHVPARLMQPGAITDLDKVGANVAATDLQPGDQLLAARLVPKDKVSQDVKDKVQISTLLAAERAVGGSLKSGDLVGVYLSFDPFDLEVTGQTTTSSTAGTTLPSTTTSAPAAAAVAADATSTSTSTTTPAPTKSPNVSRLEFQHVLVTNVQTTNTPVNTDDKDSKGVAQVTGLQYVVTLALSPEQSERFVFATEFGHVWLSSDPATVSDDGTRLVALGNVYKVVK
jgi:pilus assembly protein CpaB